MYRGILLIIFFFDDIEGTKVDGGLLVGFKRGVSITMQHIKFEMRDVLKHHKMEKVSGPDPIENKFM